MKTIKIDDLVYEIPECWKDVSLELFQDYTRTGLNYTPIEMEDPEYFILNKLSMISSLTRIPIEKLELLDITHIKTLNQCLSFINKPINKNVAIKINIDGIDLKLMDLKDLKLKEVVNIEVMVDNKNPILILDKIIGILYISDDEIIKNMDYEEKCEKIRKQVSIEGVYNLTSFFLTAYQILDAHLQTYTTMMKLKKEKKWMKMMILKMKYLLHNITTQWLIIYRAKKYSILKKFLN